MLIYKKQEVYMTAVKQQAFSMLETLSDESVVYILKILESLQAVVDEDYSVILSRDDRWIIDNGIGAAFFKGLQRILVSIEFLAFQGQKDAALRAVAAIRGDAWMLLIEMI